MAKEQKPEQTPAPAPDAAPEDVGPPKSYRLQITLGFVSIILFQMIVLFFMLPPKAQVQDRIGIRQGEMPNGLDDPPLVLPGIGKKDEIVEKEISEKAFKIKDVDGENNETLSMFIRVGIRKADERNFDRQYLKSMYQIQDRVNTVLMASTKEERKEVSRTAIKEKIKREVNDVLGFPWVQMVFFNDFTYESS